MKHIGIIVLLSSLTTFTHADTCLSEIKFVGGKNNISPSCFDLAPRNSIYNHRLVEDGLLELKVWERIIFVKNLKTGYMTRIAGGKTQLYKVLSIDYDSRNKLIYVLNENEAGEKSVLSFKNNWQGNVFPYKTIQKNHLPQDIKQVVVDYSSDSLIALAKSGKVLYSIIPGESRHLNSKSRPKLEKNFTAKVAVEYIHSEPAGLYLVYENLEWKKFDGAKDKKLLKNGKIQELKSPLKVGSL